MLWLVISKMNQDPNTQESSQEESCPQPSKPDNQIIVDQDGVYEQILPGVLLRRRDLEDPDDIDI
ncbi:MAG TPA: hypothetical protein VJJ72_00195 [Candidatus Paceibacterota bacterium]